MRIGAGTESDPRHWVAGAAQGGQQGLGAPGDAADDVRIDLPVEPDRLHGASGDREAVGPLQDIGVAVPQDAAQRSRLELVSQEVSTHRERAWKPLWRATDGERDCATPGARREHGRSRREPAGCRLDRNLPRSGVNPRHRKVFAHAHVSRPARHEQRARHIPGIDRRVLRIKKRPLPIRRSRRYPQSPLLSCANQQRRPLLVRGRDLDRAISLVIDRETRLRLQPGNEFGIQVQTVEREIRPGVALRHFPPRREHSGARPTRLPAYLAGVD